MKYKPLIILINIFFFCSFVKGQEVSTYDNLKVTNDMKSHKASLQKLDRNKVFSFIHNKLISNTSQLQKAYFNVNRDYELLFYTKGDIFLNKVNDFVFIVYDKKNVRISIILYNELKKKYYDLYRDIKVENGLKSADCNYCNFGTLDYQIADNLICQENYLIKKPESILENMFCKITKISTDKDFILKKGCFAKYESKTKLINSLCISTSSAYNNWECMKYDEAKNVFIIYYGQAFAD
jgi:hypothetical protein